jgi:hypothetical protein
MEYKLITWPESQILMEMDWFDECILMNDENHLDEMGSSAYFVPIDRYFAMLDTDLRNKFPYNIEGGGEFNTVNLI